MQPQQNVCHGNKLDNTQDLPPICPLHDEVNNSFDTNEKFSFKIDYHSFQLSIVTVAEFTIVQIFTIRIQLRSRAFHQGRLTHRARSIHITEQAKGTVFDILFENEGASAIITYDQGYNKRRIMISVRIEGYWNNNHVGKAPSAKSFEGPRVNTTYDYSLQEQSILPNNK